MAGSNLMTYGVLAVGGYFVYKYLSAPPVAAAANPAGTPAPAASGGNTGNTTGNTGNTAGNTGNTATGSSTPAPVAFNSLDAIYSRLAAAVGTASFTADQFNYYLAMQLPAGVVPPDPLAVFTSAGWVRETPMTLANYWGAVAPYLRANMGLSGLGFYGGLGQYMPWGAR